MCKTYVYTVHTSFSCCLNKIDASTLSLSLFRLNYSIFFFANHFLPNLLNTHMYIHTYMLIKYVCVCVFFNQIIKKMLSVVGVWHTLKAPKLTRGCERRTVLTMIIPNGCAIHTVLRL